MSELNLNRERMSLLRAIGDGNVFRNDKGLLMRRFVPAGNKFRVGEPKVRELQAAGLVDEQLRLTDAGKVAAA